MPIALFYTVYSAIKNGNHGLIKNIIFEKNITNATL